MQTNADLYDVINLTGGAQFINLNAITRTKDTTREREQCKLK